MAANANSERDIVSTDFSMSNSLSTAFSAADPVVADPILALFSTPRLNWRISTTDWFENVDLKYWSVTGSALMGGFPVAGGITKYMSTAMLRLLLWKCLLLD